MFPTAPAATRPAEERKDNADSRYELNYDCRTWDVAGLERNDMYTCNILCKADYLVLLLITNYRHNEPIYNHAYVTITMLISPP